jgi:hypothetical protein
MANVVYPLYKQNCLTQAVVVALGTDTIKVAIVRGYTYSAAHDYYDDITGGGGGTIVGTPQTLGSKTTTNGVFDAADPTFTAVGTTTACNHLVIYKDTGTAATSPLIACIDTATGLPVIPNGGDITIAWDNGSNKIFAL